MSSGDGTGSRDGEKEVLLLVDGNNLVYRSFFAIPPLANRKGIPTNAVYGFATVLRKLLADEKPALAAVTFDGGGKTFRHERFEAYKANRAETPDDLKQQFPTARRLCDVLGLPVLERVGVEADDLIGTLARRGLEAGYRVYIVSSDKDLLQLVRDDVVVIHPVKYQRFDAKGVVEKFGVAPDKVVDVLALMGDHIDNVPGVPGIGEKGARSLITSFGSLEAVLKRVDDVKNKRQREGLLSHAAEARLSKELVTIVTDLDVDVDFESLRYRGADRAAAFSMFEDLEFTSLLKDYLPEEKVDLSATFSLLADRVALEKLLEKAKDVGTLALWLGVSRTKEADPIDSRLVGAGLAVAPGAGFYISPSDQLPEAELVSMLAGTISHPSLRILTHDGKALSVFFGARQQGIGQIGFDTRVAAYVLNPTRRSQELNDLLLEFFSTPLSETEGPDSSGRSGQGVLPGMSAGSESESELRERAGRANAERAERILRLEQRMTRRLRDEDLETLLRDIELPLISVLADMELAGIAIDNRELETMSKEMSAELERLTAEIHELAGTEFNINSPKQLGEILFEKMNLPSFKKTQKQRMASTRVEVLEELAEHFELPQRILQYRTLAKLKGTYVDALPQLVHSRTGRIHTTFNQTVTATGRLSSSDPNLQNIPIRTELGRRIRKAIVAPEGNRLVAADYSQIELRVLAHLSGDEALIQAFREGADIHDRTAKEVFGADSSLDPAERRRRAKIINFSIIYGKTAYTLGKEFGVPTREAQAFIDAYFDRYPKVRKLIEEIVRTARRTGKVRTMFGRVRYVPEIGSRNRNTRSAAERVAVNTPVQGTAADLIKKAMVDLSRKLHEEELRARLVLQVHDELVLEVPEDELDRAPDLVRDTMENVHPMAVPLKVDVKVGRSWEH